MSLLIIGSGVVGSQVARIEVERGERPVILEIAPQPEALGDFVDLSKVKLVQGDILNPLDLARVIREERITQIIHTAANPLLTVGAQQNPYPAVYLNVVGTLNVLEAARIFGVPRVAFSSSAVLYSSMAGGEDRAAHFQEEAYPRPTTFYATTKQTGENLGMNYAQWFGLDFRAVRYAAVFGPWRGRGGGGGLTQAFRDVLQGVLKGEEATLPESLGRAELVYSKDAAYGTVLACHAEELKNRVFNIGIGRMYSSEEIAETIRKVVPKAKIKPHPQSPKARPGDAAASPWTGHSADPNRARTELGYRPQYDLEAAVRDYVQFLKA